MGDREEKALKKDVKKNANFFILRNHRFRIGLVILLLLVLVTFVLPLLIRFDAYTIDAGNRLQPPTSQHWFGTDDFGRDVLSRSLYGLRYSFGIGFVVTIVATFIGTVIGLLSAYWRIADEILMRIVDGLYAFPSILLAIAIVAIRGANVQNVVIALTIVHTPMLARVIRSAALVEKQREYVKVLPTQGAKSGWILFGHILPNVLPIIVVQATYVFATAIIAEATLSFLGAGIPAPTPSLGNILYDGKNLIFRAWWLTVFPGLLMVLLIAGLNTLGDGLRQIAAPSGYYLHRNKMRR